MLILLVKFFELLYFVYRHSYNLFGLERENNFNFVLIAIRLPFGEYASYKNLGKQNIPISGNTRHLLRGTKTGEKWVFDIPLPTPSGEKGVIMCM